MTDATSKTGHGAMISLDPHSQEAQVAFLATYPPRQCGIASFTQDLLRSVAAHGGPPPNVVAIDEPGARRSYGPEVVRRLRRDEPGDYRRIAADLNAGLADLLCVQHEYGLYGRAYGRELLTLLDRVRVPVVTTLHTTLSEPNRELRSLTSALCDQSAAIVVMSRAAAVLLGDVYDVDAARIHVIPHGNHWVEDPWSQRESVRASLGFQDRTTVMTFGLLGPNKGIEFALRALPSVVAAHPDVVYLVVGATHPGEFQRSAEGYRMSLVRLAAELGLGDHVRFEARYLPNEELRRWLSAADICLLPFVEPEQVSSGTLGWAMGCGCAVISTDFRYARELLSGGDGRLVPLRDSAAIGAELVRLLEDREQRAELGRRAHEASWHTRWEDAGGRYHRLFGAVRSGQPDTLSRSLQAVPGGW